jgi:hypothetical protein
VPSTGSEVWLTEKTECTGPTDVLGIFSTPEAARQACQESADEYLGAAKTPPLQWLGHAGYMSADYTHPANGVFLFQVTMFVVDSKGDNQS